VRLLASLKARGPVLVTGGLARDAGLLAAMGTAAAKQKLPVEMRAHADSAFAGALGAALWGAFRRRRLERRGHGLGAAR